MSDAEEEGSRPSEEGEDEEEMRKRHNKETRVRVYVCGWGSIDSCIHPVLVGQKA